MKKIILSVMACLSCMMMTSCGGFATTGTTAQAGQTTATGLTASSATAALGNIISSVIGGAMTSQATLVGTWTYTQPCVQFESENLLAQAGGAVVASQAEATLATYYQKVGIKPGALTFVFGSDGSLTYSIGNIQRVGSYTFDAQNRTVTIMTQLGQSVKAYVTVTGTAMGLTFDASKLLNLVNMLSSKSSSLSQISAIAGNYKGMKLGFQFSK